MPEQSDKIFKFYFCDDQGRTYYVDANNNVQKGSENALKNAPEGWQDIQVTQPRNNRYYALERNYTSSYKVVKDGARIIRYLLYNSSQKSFNSKLFFVVLKWDTINGYFDTYYTSEVDLSKITDDPRTGVSVNMIEGGAAKSIKTNENVIYEIPCNDTIDESVQILFDGIDLFDTVSWATFGAVLTDFYWTYPIVFVGNDGDSVGVQANGQTAEYIPVVDLPAYLIDSPNNFFSAKVAIVGQHFKGKLKYTCTDQTSTPSETKFWIVRSGDDATDQSTWIPIFNITETIGQEVDQDFDVIIDLAADERAFLIVELLNNGSGGNHAIEVAEDEAITMSIVTRVPESTAYALKPFDLFSALVAKIGDGRWKAEGTLLNEKWYLLATSGDAIRKFPAATIKTSFADFYDSYGKVLNAAIGVRQSDQTILFERKEYFFDNATEIVNIGEVANFRISVTDDYLFSSVKVGSPDQDYGERNGREEVNSEDVFSFPESRLQKELDLITKYRTDPYGIEFIRFDLIQKSTTDNVGDNNVFIVNVDPAQTAPDNFIVEKNTPETYSTPGEFELNFDTVTDDFTDMSEDVDLKEFTYNGVPQTVNLSVIINGTFAGTVIGFTIKVNGNPLFLPVTFNTSPFTFSQTASMPLNTGDVITVQPLFLSGTLTISDATLTLPFASANGLHTVYKLKRLTYDAITGITAIDTIFNIEELTPKRILLANASLYGGALYSLPGEVIKFESGKKNTTLSTTIGGVTITENADVMIGELAPSYYRPFIFEFNTKVPINILNLLNSAGKGYITFTWNGVELKGFPLEISVKPAFLDSQDWKLLCSSQVDIGLLENLLANEITIEGQAMISHKNSLKWVPVTETFPLQYHLQHMDNDWHINRTTRYAVNKQYYQKQQVNDTTPVQVITESVAVGITILNCKGVSIDTVSFASIINAAVVNPLVLWEAEVNWSLYEPGIYYVLLTLGTGLTAKQFISEPVMVADDWPDTLLFECTNSINLPDMIFNAGHVCKLRVEGIIEKFKPDSKFTSYEDDPLDIDTLYGVPFRTHTLFIGGDFGMPDWLIDKVQRLLVLDGMQIEGYFYSCSPDAKLEAVDIDGSPFKYWSIPIREKNNRPGLVVTGVGTDGGDLTVEYNINTKAFTSIQTPTVDQTDNIVQVIDVE